MGLQKYVANCVRPAESNGSVAHVAEYGGRVTLSKVAHCPLVGQGVGMEPRMVYLSALEQVWAGTWPARAMVNGRVVQGNLFRDGFEGEDGFVFAPFLDGGK